MRSGENFVYFDAKGGEKVGKKREKCDGFRCGAEVRFLVRVAGNAWFCKEKRAATSSPEKLRFLT